MATINRTQVLEVRRNFFLSITLCVGALILVHLAPKSTSFANPARLFYAAIFFSSSLLLCVQLLAPRRRYQESLYQWRFADAPQPLERAWKAYLYSLNLVVSVTTYIVMTLLISLTLMTMALWFPVLQGIAWIYNGLWWIAVIGLIIYPFFGGFLFNELAQRYRAFNEQIATGRNCRPRSMSSDPEICHDPETFAVKSGGEFRAGGIRWTWQDFTRNCIIFGLPGSGKTSCVLNTLLEGVLGAAEANRELPSGLILDPKGDYLRKIETLCRRYGRQRDLLIIDPHDRQHGIRWNPLDSQDDELELAGRFVEVMESLGVSGGDNSFWVDNARRFIRHSISLLRHISVGNEPPRLTDIHAMAGSFAEIADRTDRLNPEDPSIGACLAFFDEWVNMAPNQRSGVQSHITTMLDAFSMEPYASVFAGRSNYRIFDMIHQGKILYVHMPVEKNPIMARMIGTLIKLEYYREVLRAVKKVRPSFFVCDEFQQFFTFGDHCGDADFFERSRDSNHGNLIVTHNIASLARRSPRREPVTNLLGLCATKLFLRNSDEETNEFASKLYGEEIMALAGAAGGHHGGRGLGARVINQNDQFVRLVPPDVFVDLAIPDSASGNKHCESMIILGARSQNTREIRKLRWPLHLITS